MPRPLETKGASIQRQAYVERLALWLGTRATLVPSTEGPSLCWHSLRMTLASSRFEGTASNSHYVAALQAVTQKMGLPESYVAGLAN
ncbi:hypothetical protein ABIF64_006660 [Bradyrhizobium japonicum]